MNGKLWSRRLDFGTPNALVWCCGYGRIRSYLHHNVGTEYRVLPLDGTGKRETVVHEEVVSTE